MVLGLGYAEIALVVGAGAVLFGPKDLAKISRLSGKAVGWAVGYLQHARGHLQEMGGASELAKMHHEMQETLRELNSIRNEVRQGARILSPMNTIPSPDHSQVSGNALTPNPMDTESPEAKNVQGHILSSVANGGATNHITEPLSQSKPLNHHASEFPLQNPFIAQRLGSNLSPSGEGLADGDALGKIPVSAVSAGLTQLRESSSSGSDILLDALLEEEVAHKAQAFLESNNGNIGSNS